MGRKIPHLKWIKDFKAAAGKHMEIDKILLFGSFARGDSHQWSDIDLVIVSKDFAGIKRVRRPIKLYDYWTVKYPVEFLCYTPEEFEKMSKKITIVREAVREGVEI